MLKQKSPHLKIPCFWACSMLSSGIKRSLGLSCSLMLSLSIVTQANLKTTWCYPGSPKKFFSLKILMLRRFLSVMPLGTRINSLFCSTLDSRLSKTIWFLARKSNSVQCVRCISCLLKRPLWSSRSIQRWTNFTDHRTGCSFGVSTPPWTTTKKFLSPFREV